MRRWPRILTKDGIQAYLDRKNFKPQSLRGLVMGITITTTIAEITAYKLIKLNVEVGELPYYTPEIMIIAFSIFEALLAPLMSWWGYRRRRTTLIRYVMVLPLCFMMWFFLSSPGETNDSVLCDAQGTGVVYGMTSRSIASLMIISLTCGLFILIRVACWSHGVAYIDEYAPERAHLHYGILVTSRVVALTLAFKYIISVVVESFLFVHVLLAVIGSVLNIIQVQFIIPKVVPEVDGVQKTSLPLEERGFLISLGRVLHSSVAMMQMLAMGLMAAAIWGFGYYEGDIIKEKFYLLHEIKYADTLLYHFVVGAIVAVGDKLSAPILKGLSNLKAIKRVTIISLITCMLYIAITKVPRCEKGEIAGLSQGVYGQPECSLSCNCNRQEFEPVCVVDEMVTYVSPCLAGCTDSSISNGVQVYANCTCSPNERVIPGACRYADCKEAQRLHSVLFMIIITFTLLVFQSQIVLILRSVDIRDKSLAMGLTWSMVAIIAFVCGHLLFYKIQAMDCAWYKDEGCFMQKESFPFHVGGTSATLAFSSTIISIISWICIRMLNRI